MTATPITITNDYNENQHTLWWRPFLYLQKEMHDTCKHACCNMMLDLPFVQDFWNAEENMLHISQAKIHQVFSQMFNHRQMFMPWIGGHATEPYIDIINNERSIEIKADVAGLEPEDINVYIEDHAVRICGERKDKKEVKEYDYIRHECHTGNFNRVIALPERADTSNASASLDHHVLTVHVPKTYSQLSKTTPIPIDQQTPNRSAKKPTNQKTA